MIRKSRKNVGLIGLGIIGTRVAAQLRANGFHAYVWSRSPHPVPNFLSSPAEIADVCPIIQIFVSDGDALLKSIHSLTANLTSQHLVICSATVGREATLEAAKLVEAHGSKFLDAPFTGSKDAAANGQLVYFIGGSDDAFAQAEPVLQASSKQIVRVGKIGDAAVVKIATNMIAAATVQTLAEALAIVKTAGLDPAVMTAVIERHGTRSPLIDQKLAAILNGNFEPHFALRHMLKDVNLGLLAASAHGLYLPATSAASIALAKGVQSDWADLDYAALAKTFGLGEKPQNPAIEKSAPAIEKNSESEKTETANHHLPEVANHEPNLHDGKSDEEKKSANNSIVVNEPAEPIRDEFAVSEPKYEPTFFGENPVEISSENTSAPTENPADEIHESPAANHENSGEQSPHEPAPEPLTASEPHAPSPSDLVDSQPIPAIPARAVHKPAHEENSDEDDAFRTTMKIDLDPRTTMKLDDDPFRTTMKIDYDSARTTEKLKETPTPNPAPLATPRVVEDATKTIKRTPIQVHVPEDRDIVEPNKKRGFFGKLFSKKTPEDIE